MPTIDAYLGDDERKRKRRRGKWLLPLFVGLIAAFALGREKTPVVSTPKPVVAPPPVVTPPPVVIEVPPVVPAPIETPPVETPQVPLPSPARLAVSPVRLDFGDGPLTWGVPADSRFRGSPSAPTSRFSSRMDAGARSYPAANA